MINELMIWFAGLLGNAAENILTALAILVLGLLVIRAVMGLVKKTLESLGGISGGQQSVCLLLQFLGGEFLIISHYCFPPVPFLYFSVAASRGSVFPLPVRLFASV